MTKVYWCTDKHDNSESTVVVNDQGCAWWCGKCRDFDAIKIAEKHYAYDPSESFEERAINPVLMAEW